MCINEERLELYVLGRRLPQPEGEALEDHLLLCKRCQEHAVQIRLNAEAIRTDLEEAPPLLVSSLRFQEYRAQGGKGPRNTVDPGKS
jgi:hypothetical protein